MKSYQKRPQKPKNNYLALQKKRRRALKKDYQAKKLDNPFYNRRAKREEKISGRLKTGIIGLAVLALFLFWFFMYSPVFTVKNVEVHGLTRINSRDLNNLVFAQSGERRSLIFRQSNLFAFSSQELSNRISNGYNFAQIKIGKKLPHTISINISERSCALIWENASSSCYFVDPNGFLIKDIGVQDADRNNLPVVSDERGLPSDGNQINLDRQYLDFMLELYSKIGKTDLKVDKFVIDKNPDTLRVNLKNGPFLLFSLKEDQDKQLGKLIILRQEKLKDNFNNIQYFDLRYGDKVYYIDNKEAGKSALPPTQ